MSTQRKLSPKPRLFLTQPHKAGTLNAFVRDFLSEKWHEDLCSPSHVSHLHFSLVMLSKHLQNPALTDVQKRSLKEFVDDLFVDYSPNNIRNIVGDMQNFFGWVERKGHLDDHLARRLQKPKKRASQLYVPPRSDVQRVIHHLIQRAIDEDIVVAGDNQLLHINSDRDRRLNIDERRLIRDAFIVAFMGDCGCRPSQLSNLGRKKMLKATKVLRPSHRVVSHGKTDSVIRFTGPVAHLFHLWEEVRPKRRCERYAVFAWGYGKKPAPLETDGITALIQRRGAEAGVTPFSSNALRHLKIRHGRQTVGLEITSKLVDHSSIEVTQNYGGDLENELLDSAAVRTGIPVSHISIPLTRKDE